MFFGQKVSDGGGGKSKKDKDLHIQVTTHRQLTGKLVGPSTACLICLSSVSTGEEGGPWDQEKEEPEYTTAVERLPVKR